MFHDLSDDSTKKDTREKQFMYILKNEMIYPVYQPIVSLKDGRIFAFEALSRPKLNTKLNIVDLFEIASELGKLWEFERLCRSKALQESRCKPDNTKLFINVDPNIINDTALREGFTCQKLKEYNLNAANIVFEITETNQVDSHLSEEFRQAVAHYQNQFFEIAIDDFGSGYSGLNRVCKLSPNFIKLDIELIREIDRDKVKQSAVKSFTDFAHQQGIKTIAEGLETKEELKAVAFLGVDYVQGYYLGKPSETFFDIPKKVKQEITSLHKQNNNVSSSCGLNRIREICKPREFCRVDDDSFPLYKRMQADQTLSEVFVLDYQDKVCGIITRTELLADYGGQYGYNLSRRKAVTDLASESFMSVDYTVSINDTASMAMKRDATQIYDAVAVLENGKYIGSVKIRDLLLATINIQVQNATDANPLTKLPGNSVVQSAIGNAISCDEFRAIIYFDIDNFKPYNDAYGFSSGDKMIRAVVEALQTNCKNNDFLGHIGGDDFVVITDNKNITEFCNNVFMTFRDVICPLYSTKDWNKGYIQSRDRNGFARNFSIATLSAAAVTNEFMKFAKVDEVSSAITKAKKKSKQIDGNSIVIL